jgi:predicted TIM-barrel fold metal-dependent hydrolase
MADRVISVDDHVQEPPDLWTSRLSTKWGERVPHLDRTNGHEQWVVDGQVLLGGHVAEVGALMENRSQEPERWADVPPAAYVPSKRLEAMDEMGIEATALFPTVAGVAGEAFARLDDGELELACVRAYNDWLIEEWSSASDRFIPQCIVPIWPPEAAAEEIRRAVTLGHRGVVFPSVPMFLRDVPHIGDAAYDPVWAACEELGVPLCLHAWASPQLQYQPLPDLSPARAEALNAVTRPVSSVFVIAAFSFSRVLLRHPRLRVVLAESALGWGMLYLEKADHEFRQDGLPREGYELTPSEMFHRQCYFTSWFDKVAPVVDRLGAANILWSTNFPLATSTWPNTKDVIDRCFQGVKQETREQLLWQNAAQLYQVK